MFRIPGYFISTIIGIRIARFFSMLFSGIPVLESINNTWVGKLLLVYFDNAFLSTFDFLKCTIELCVVLLICGVPLYFYMGMYFQEKGKTSHLIIAGIIGFILFFIRAPFLVIGEAILKFLGISVATFVFIVGAISVIVAWMTTW